MKRLRLSESKHPEPMVTTKQAELPTWGQIKNLTWRAQQMTASIGEPATPTTLLLAMLALLSAQVQPSTADPHWAYVPNPPLLHPVSWNERNVLVYVNDKQALGVPSSHHIKATSHGNYTYFGMNGNVPICLSKGGNYTGCVTVNGTTLTNKNGTHWTVIMQYLRERPNRNYYCPEA